MPQPLPSQTPDWRVQNQIDAISFVLPDGPIATIKYVDDEIATVVAGGINFASATTITGVNGEGVDTDAARADHDHALGADTVGASQIQTGAVGSDEIATGAVGSDELADDAVDTAAIQNNAVTAAKVAADVATQAELDTHEADTTNVHGIANTSALVLTTDGRLPTASQKAALAGTDGTPSDTNRYVTDSDGRLDLSSVAYSVAVLALNPALYWRFSETAGTDVDDSTANNRDGTTTGTVTRNQTSLLTNDADPAIDLGGGYVTSTYDAFTANSTRTFIGIASRDTSATTDTLFGDEDGNALLRLDTSQNVNFLSGASWTAAWPGDAQTVYWALVFQEVTDTWGDGTSGADTWGSGSGTDYWGPSVASLYINGNLVSTQYIAESWSTSATQFRLGATGAGTDPFDGKMDEVAIFEYGLSAGQIAGLYAAGTGNGGAIPKATADAKGDLIVGSSDNNVDNLTVGANDTLLVADSGQTLGVKWANVTSAMITNGTVTDTDLASPNNSAYKTIWAHGGGLGTDAVAGTYLFTVAGIPSASPVTLSAAGFLVIPFFRFNAADYAVAGKTTVMRLVFTIGVNATSAAMNFTAGLYPLTVAGAADNMTYTAGTVVSGSTRAHNSPTASTLTSGNSGDFTIPSDGAYTVAVVTSGTLTNNCQVACMTQIQVRNT